MQRRTVLKMSALSAAGAVAESTALGRLALGEAAPTVQPVKRVLLVTKCHLDVGFTQTQAQVMRKYFEMYYPEAMKISAGLRRAGGDRYTWTTGSWLLYEYLEQASSTERKAMEAAIAAGDIAWHALPFNWQTEMLDRSMIEGSLGFSRSLDGRFGHTTVGSKMTDVPGHSRGLIAPLHAAGIRMLDIGVNAASTPPDVPDVFLWKDLAGHSLAMMYHRHDYGGVLRIPGSDVAVDVEVRGDNSGPHTPAEIAAIYARLRAQFPGASVHASNLNEVAAALEPVRDRLPVVTGEIGDTWIYGCASDPQKIAQYREAARLRKQWLAQKRFASGDAVDRQLLRRLLLAPEHTWGTDTKTYLDSNHYRPRDLITMLDTPGYKTMEVSWQEKRDDIGAAIATLPDALRTEVEERFRALRAKAPSSEGMTRHDPSQPVETAHYTIGLDPATGAIHRLLHKKSGREWASAAQPLALFTYQTLSQADYTAYRQRYVVIQASWAPRDFGKPGIERFGAAAQEWHPRIVNCWRASTGGEARVLLELRVEDAAALALGNVAWPQAIYMELRMPDAEPRIDLAMTTLGKQANRMPEAMWLSFNPASPQGVLKWSLDKVDEPVDPADVVRGGGRSMHAITSTLRYEDAQRNAFEVRTLDAPVVALGVRSPLNFSFAPPELAGGAHFSLFNNAWGTNYPQWSGGDWAYRFTLLA